MNDLDTLNRRFGIAGQLSFTEGPGGMLFVQVRNALADGDIALQGAHLTTWQPKGESPIIWLSPQARFAPGKSIRGGIPICWPWFGAHPTNPKFPAHGFARTVEWQVVDSTALPDGATRIRFELPLTDALRTQWPHDCRVTYDITVGRELLLELATTNTGDAPFTLSEALHAYFAIGDIDDILIAGLEGCGYLDKVDGFRRKTEPGAIKIAAETDWVYLDTTADNVIKDRRLRRSIRISKQGGHSSIVWNPWTEKSRQMGDMGEDGYRRMVCVESGNAADNAVTLAPGATHRLQVRYRIETI